MFNLVDLQPKGIVFTALAIFPRCVNSRMIASSLTNGGTLEIVTFVAGACSGVMDRKLSFNQTPLSINRLTNFSFYRKITTALFM